MRNPDYFGRAGKAWRIDVPAFYKSINIAPDKHAVVACWVLHAPASHPLWPWCRMILLDLVKPMPHLPPPDIYVEGATHEMVLEALNPDIYPPTVDGIPADSLVPANFAAQFTCSGDTAAIIKIEQQAVLPIVHGVLNPDTDGMREWMSAFGDQMIRKDCR